MKIAPLLTAIAIASAPAYSRGAPAVAVDVDASALPKGEVTDDLVRHIVEHQTQVLADGGLEVREDASLTILVTVSRYGEGNVNYRASIAVFKTGSDTPTAERTLTCELCRDGDLVVRIGEEVARLSGFILYAPEEDSGDDGTGTPAEPEDGVDEQSQGQDDGSTATPPPAAIGPMGYVGIGTLVMGTGSLAAGIALSLLPDQTRPAGDVVERRSTHTTGVVLASVGGVLVASGIALLTVDVVRRKRQRRVTFRPFITPERAVVSMGVRF